MLVQLASAHAVCAATFGLSPLVAFVAGLVVAAVGFGLWRRNPSYEPRSDARTCDQQVDEEHEARMERLPRLINLTRHAIAVTDLDNNIVWTNKAFESLTEFSAGAALHTLPGQDLHSAFELKINYVSSMVAARAIAEAVIVRRGSRLSVVQVHISDDTGKKIAAALVTCAYRNEKTGA